MTRRLRIGTRGSPLALIQAEAVGAALMRAHAGLEADYHVVRTSGDRIQDRPLAEVGGKGLFTKEIEQALLDGAIDLAVHSMKDVETFLPDALCIAAMLPLILILRRRLDAHESAAANAAAAKRQLVMPFSPATLQTLLCIAGIACCVAMSMPQVHIVAYCGDLGYGPARGAEMLSLMLGCGIVSRVASGFIADRIGGVRTLLLGSVLQGTALFLYLLFDGLTSLYVISAMFGLFQGGIVPSYAIIVREYFPASQAGTRVGVVLFATLIGMALGGWMSGLIFDITGSYQAAFMNGIGWNLMNVTIMVWLLLQSRRQPRPQTA